MRWHGRLITVALFCPFTLLAQDTAAAGRARTPTCYHSEPRSACAAFILTNAGFYYAPAFPGPGAMHASWDLGFMWNTGRQEAVGAALFANLRFSKRDDTELLIGPAFRYRNWLSRRRSLDVALGVAYVSTVRRSGGFKNGYIGAGALFGLLKWSPEPWLGFAARSELIEGTLRMAGCGLFDCVSFENSATRVRLAVGVEIGWMLAHRERTASNE